MLRRIIIGSVFIFIALSILFVSVLRSVSVRHDFVGNLGGNTYHSDLLDKDFHIDYQLAFPGKILPDSPFWSIKAIRDRFWLSITADMGRKADLLLLFADKRLGASVILFDKEEYEKGYTTLMKAEDYLQRARDQGLENKQAGQDTKEFFIRLTDASIKHAIVIEELSVKVPDEVVPELRKENDVPRKVYTDSRNALREMGIETPNNPFNW